MEKKYSKDGSTGASIHARRAIAYIVLILVSILCLFWFYLLIITATRSNAELSKGFTLLPSSHLLENWNNLVAGDLPIVSGMINSIIVASASTVLCVYFSALTAYAIHAYEFKARKFMFKFILMIMMIPGQVGALGFVKLIVRLGMDDTFWPLILPAIASPVTFFYIKQYMQSALPLSLVEAARMDGGGEIYIFNRIVLPLMKPAIAVQAIFSFVGSWNNYFTPALILHSSEKKTLPVLIALLRGADFLKFDMGQVYVMIAFSIFPVIVVYLILSKFIVQGVALGSVKG